MGLVPSVDHIHAFGMASPAASSATAACGGPFARVQRGDGGDQGGDRGDGGGGE